MLKIVDKNGKVVMEMEDGGALTFHDAKIEKSFKENPLKESKSSKEEPQHD